MFRSFALTALSLLMVVARAPAAADPLPAATPATLSPAEARFVHAASAILAKRYPTPAAAEAGGYVRYTNEDETGAISYANRHWDSSSVDAPSQLWYDVHGRLLGADYSVPVAGHPAAPARFGIDPSRFFEANAHVHYVVRNSDGTLTYSRAIGFKKYAATGLDAMHPTAAGLVRAGAVAAPERVATVFLFPHIWDVTVWLIPNPAGPFADANPNVKPSRTPNPTDIH